MIVFRGATVFISFRFLNHGSDDWRPTHFLHTVVFLFSCQFILILLPCLSAINYLLVHFWKCFFVQLFCWQCCLAFSWPCWHKGCWVSGIGYSGCSFTETITMWWREHIRYWWNWLYLEKKKTWLASNIRDNKMDFLNEVSGESQQETECCFRLLTKCFWSERVRTFIFVNLFSMSQSCKKQFK